MRTPLRLWLSLALAVGPVLLPTAPLEAQSTECSASTSDGTPRNCTQTEVMGLCLYEALDSRRSCVQDFPEWWLSWACEAFFVWDGAACLAKALIPF